MELRNSIHSLSSVRGRIAVTLTLQNWPKKTNKQATQPVQSKLESHDQVDSEIEWTRTTISTLVPISSR